MIPFLLILVLGSTFHLSFLLNIEKDGEIAYKYALMVLDVQIILEGMGRALHTNFNAKFKCDALKV